MLTLHKAMPDEIEPLQEIVRLCGEDIGACFGLTFWSPPPPIELMRRHAAENAVYAVQEADEAVATFTLGLSGWPEQSEPFWTDADHRAAYISRLAVRPDRQGQGIGRWCLAEVERLARAQDCRAIRLDAIRAFALPIALYRQLGYEERGIVLWTNWYGIPRELLLMEKLLGGDGEQ
jgi:ribosomal protein S18 acetylase RimI-like enzyme